MTSRRPHPSDDDIEAYSMGRLAGSGLQEFETHLFVCQGCRERVVQTDVFLKLLRKAFTNTRPPMKGAKDSEPREAETERRRQLREVCSKLVAVRIRGAAKSETPTVGLLVDKSPSGVGIYANSPMEHGVLVSIRTSAIRYHGVVRYCAAHGSMFHLGVEFSGEAGAG
jgi:hypothetical protein